MESCLNPPADFIHTCGHQAPSICGSFASRWYRFATRKALKPHTASMPMKIDGRIVRGDRSVGRWAFACCFCSTLTYGIYASSIALDTLLVPLPPTANSQIIHHKNPLDLPETITV